MRKNLGGRLESEALKPKPAGEAPGKREELLRSIVNNIAAVIHVKHPDGRYLLVNSQFEKLFNVTLDKIRDKTAHDLFPGEIAEILRAHDLQVLRTRERLQAEEQVPHGDGMHTYLSVRFPLLDDAGEPWATCGISTDITDRRQAEEALRQREAQLRALVETTRVIAWEADAQSWEFRYVSPIAEEILGYPLSDWFQNGFWSSHIHSEDRDRVVDFCRTASASCTDFEFDYRMIAADQRVIWIRDLVHVVFEGHRPKLIRGFLLDITEHKRTEEALQESQRRYALATAAGRVGVWDWNLETNEIYVDPVLKLTLGYQEHEVLDPMDVWSRLVHPSDKQQFLSKIRSHFEGGTPHFESEYRMLHKDGRELWFLARGTVMRDSIGRPYRIMLTNTEITQQKQILGALQAAEGLKRGVLDSLSDHIAVLDRTGTIIDVNAAWYRFAVENDVAAKSLVGPGTNYLEIVGQAGGESSQTVQQVIDGIQSVLDGRKGPFTLEYSCPSPEEERWFLMTVTPLRRVQGGAVVAHTDITGRKRAEEALRSSQKELQDLTAQIFSAQEEERRRLARELHDDLTQKLAVLALDIGKLERQNTALPTNVCEMLRTMKEQIVKLSVDIHGISRQLHPSILDDLGLVDAIRSECDLFSDREGILVQFLPEKVPEDLPKDVSLCVYRVTQEGLRNIAKHARSKQARVVLKTAENGLQLIIQDWGVGFDPARLRGPGLGLASIRERMRLLQASVLIQSEPGKGTTIRALIPLPRKMAQLAASQAASQ